ncbi:hypothetical protein B0H14DRAFT_2644523, partial [Mycena olivaceomarginata]
RTIAAVIWRMPHTRGDEVHEEEEVPTIEQDILPNGYKELCRFIVPLRKILAEADHEEWLLGSRNARSDDTKNLREAIVPWLVAAFPELSPSLDPDSRERIVESITTIWAGSFARVRAAIREGDPNYLITAGSWWAGLYPPGKFDPALPEAHLFTNVLLLKTMPKDKELPTLSPTRRASSSTPRTIQRKKLGSKSKAQCCSYHRLRTVTGRSIAYAAVQASAVCQPLDNQDGGFDYREFYNNIVEYFEFPPGPVARNEVARLLDWGTRMSWNHPAVVPV